jgi:hypothetical protein
MVSILPILFGAVPLMVMSVNPGEAQYAVVARKA